ncbi:MAG: hypothetical protein O2854_09675, partial [Chloroflexi bacterium]|nr:hypothetical protein [Chloroflexota bacterium]
MRFLRPHIFVHTIRGFAVALLIASLVAACGDGSEELEVEPTLTATVTQATATSVATPVPETDTSTPSPTSSGLLDTAASPFASGRMFADSSPFNQPIPQNVAIHPDSDALVQAFADRTPDGIVVSVEQWTVTAFLADATTPRVDVRLTADWAPYGVLLDVP